MLAGAKIITMTRSAVAGKKPIVRHCLEWPCMLTMSIPDVEISVVFARWQYRLILSPEGANVYGSRSGGV